MDENYKVALDRIKMAKKQKAKSLQLNELGLKQLPEEIIELTNLQILDLDENQITTLPQEIGRLTSLETLYLEHNQLNSLPESFGELTNLSFLNIASNQLNSLPESFGELTNLSFLNIASNQLNSLPENIGELTNLELLDLEGNQLTYLPESIGKLTNLGSLYLLGNRLTYLPKSIGKLTNLESIILKGNQLNSLPENIGKLTYLELLDLEGNQLNSLPENIGRLTNLESLDLKGNQLNSLPKSIGKLTKLRSLYLEANRFEVGEEVFGLPPAEQIQEILKWQKAKRAGELRPIHEAKVIFIGESDFGKTHLIEYLREGKIKRQINTTHGIERQQLQIPFKDTQIRLNIWDLGGQEFMRSTHQFFFSERTIYVLVTLARRERNELNHWLRLAEKLGKQAPVIVVINKIDLDPHDLDRKSLQRDYPNIVGFVRTCIKDCNDGVTANDTLSELKAKIAAVATNSELMPEVFEKRRPEWFTVKEELEKLGEAGKDFISYQDYDALQHIKTLPPDERKRNLKLLNMLGAVVSYVDDPRLMDTNVINPQWIMDGVYAIINDPIIKDENKGQFRIGELKRVLDPNKFPEVRHNYLLELMHKFNICYRTSQNSDTYFIPDLFEDIEPTFDWDNETAMQFRYDYGDFPPNSFMTKFIVEMHGDIVGNNRWRSGALLSNGSCQAKVYQTFRKNHIHVDIQGELAERRLYLYYIRQSFRKLHDPFPEMGIMEGVPYKDHWLDYSDLLEFEKSGIPFYHPKLKVVIPVVEILNGYSTYNTRLAKNRSENTLLEHIIEACSQLQGKQKTIMPDEDSRNEYIATMLANRGIIAKGQARYGSSASKKREGEVDIKFENENGTAIGIYV